MKPVKLIVTNKSKLQWKYGKNFSKLNTLLKELKDAGNKQGLDTRIAFVDDATSMKPTGVKKLKVDSEQEYKRVVDDLYKKYIPAYILILGAQDVVPFQEIDNPTEDEDPNVPSDLPYACDTPHSTKIENFTGPTRVVGRIPDLLGQQPDASYLQKLVTNSIKHKPLKAEAYHNYMSVSADVWKKSTQLSLQSMFGQSKSMLLSPAGKLPKKYKPYTKKQLAPLTHFYNCHGANNDFSYYGQKGSAFPEALESANLPGNIRPGTVVAAECCYGAQLFDPGVTGQSGTGIAASYLGNNAIAFVGSSTIAYGPADSQGLADLLTQYFIKNVLKGASTGRAFLEARQRFLTEVGPDLDPVELKTLAQFYLLGDPSVQPSECEEAEILKISVGTAIANSRKNLFMKGMSLGESIGITKRLRNATPLKARLLQSGSQSMAVDEILKKNNFSREDKKAVYSVTPKVADAMGLQKKFGGKDVKFHTYIQNPMERLKNIRVLVVKENAAQILGWKVYESR
ncbi:MAG TPA: C25 family cysteine peptidase [Flavisolibacter sp.]|jgi:hypothetical protein|nr:C25 family cysteine peptidase [Flavisolibacter sp.]